MEELNKKIPQLPWIIAVVGIVVAGWFFLSASKVNTEISDRQCELNAYNLMEAIYGRGSDRYYADKPVLILRTEGDENSIIIFWENSNIESSDIIMDHPNIVARWQEGWFGEKNHLTKAIVTPGKNSGCYPVTFTNNLNEDKFQVLVVVK